MSVSANGQTGRGKSTKDIPFCDAPNRDYEPAAFAVPDGACDTHAHVVSVDPRFPMVADRSYTPPAATESDYLGMLNATGMTRGVVIQISVNGTDNRYMLSVVAKHPERLRGVVVVDPLISEVELAGMHEAGIRGARLNVLFGGGVGFDQMEVLAAKIANFGWHLQLLLDARELPGLLPRLAKLPIPVVVDHMGHMPAELGVDHAGFQALLSLVRDHGGWAKLSGAYRIDPNGPEYPAASRFAMALVETAPERLVYGSDWPHVAPPFGMPNTGRMRNLILEWVHDRALLQRILVDNPAALYDFPA